MLNLKKQILLYLFVIFSWSCVKSQTITINGYISDVSSGEKLIGAIIYDVKTKKNVLTNNFGFYSINFSHTDSIALTVSYLGYLKQHKTIAGRNNQNINFHLDPNNQYLKEVVITDDKRIEDKTQMSTLEVPLRQIKSLPTFMGEIDVLKTFQLMPGVQGGAEGSNALYVRGGSPDQNLILLDDVPLYYVSHLGGFVSVFDANTISHVKLIKGGFPAQYGGRLSSVIDIRMKDGNENKLRGEFALGTLVSKISLEGPIFDKKTTFIFSARRSFFDLFTRSFYLFRNLDGPVTYYNFYDINFKICHKLNDKNKLFISFYSGGDKFKIQEKYEQIRNGNETTANNYKTGILWGNTMLSLRWNHEYNNKLFGNTTVSYSNFKYKNFIRGTESSNSASRSMEYIFTSGINDVIVKSDFDYYFSDKHKIKFGIAGILHAFHPGMSSYTQTGNDLSGGDTIIDPDKLRSTESYVFIEDEFSITKKVALNAGIHASAYFVQNTSFYSLQPRLSLNYKFIENYSMKISFATMKQNLHLLTNSGAGFPTDLWVPSTKKVDPEKSMQAAIGIAHSIIKKNLNLEVSIEGYYKRLNNLIDFQEGVSFFSPQTWEEKIVKNGKGNVYGIEFLVYKKEGKLNGWFGYTYSKNTRQFTNLNGGTPFPYRYDRPHNASVVINYELNDKISFSCSWVYESGNAITLASQKSDLFNYNYNYSGTNSTFEIYDDVHLYNGRNSYRMPAFHKLDIGVNFVKKVRRGIRTWNISIYNVYNRQNAFMLYFKTVENQVKLFQTSLFPIIPSVGYSLKF